MRTMFRKPVLIGTLLGMCLAGCREKVTLTVRTDSAPLARRLKLPEAMGPVRWVSVSSVRDSGGVPGPADFYIIYASIELDKSAWTAMDQTAGPPGPAVSLTLPHEIAGLVIPPSSIKDLKSLGDDQQAEGPSFRVEALSADPKTEVQKAIRLGGALIVQMEVH
jgi:hypothetical protein